MRKISAAYIFPITQAPIKNGIIVIDDSGTILELAHSNKYPQEEVEYHNGIICPGFVNTHCHLELSFLKGKIPERSGLIGFIKSIRNSKKQAFPELKEAIINAEEEMIHNGIVAVGDISNNKDAFFQKAKNRLQYHNFLEVYGFVPSTANTIFNNMVNTAQELTNEGHEKVTLTPHAPYSVSKELFRLITRPELNKQHIFSIHNQESKEENRFFIDKSGDFPKLYKQMGTKIDFFEPTGNNSLPSILPYFPSQDKLLLVHNTFTLYDEIILADQLHPNLWWCFCPNANLHIEDRLPRVQDFAKANAKICIGTDSLASNTKLSILEELITIHTHYPDIPLQQLLMWSTLNGAIFLNLENALGSIEKGKTPGLNLIENIVIEKMMLTRESKVKKLI